MQKDISSNVFLPSAETPGHFPDAAMVWIPKNSAFIHNSVCVRVYSRALTFLPLVRTNGSVPYIFQHNLVHLLNKIS